MEPKQIGMVVVAALLIVVAVVLVMKNLGGDDAEVETLWVCSACGEKATVPLGNQSPDCPKCSDGQLVQRVFFRCKKCDKETFEGYQVSLSPLAERAAKARKEAGPRPKGMLDDDLQLIRGPEGKWYWRSTAEGSRIARKMSCPTCGELKRDSFEMVSDPSKIPVKSKD